MQRKWICTQGHEWLAEGDATAAGAFGCPQCGAAGNVSEESGFRADTVLHEPQTLALGEVPPWVEPLPTVIQGRPAAFVTLHGEQPKLVGDYEILGEVARGGMGVIYRARRRGLNRVVALKMILAGEYAGEEAQQRFRLEAEAIARLEHPNVIRIYDVGEYESRMYFVLEFIDGPNLHRQLNGKPLPATTAARLVETLAKAMAFVHARGIVHRDLTPSNVLLSRAPMESDRSGKSSHPSEAWDHWTLKITDFGLAKRLDDDAGRTRTGVVMGTPSYMAPEQASATKAEIGPACDIYALGAILYEMLCGRPPFIGDTALATLEQVLQDEPVAPRRLQPRLPRDLETICLRSLEKSPLRRYSSTDELAQDLGRFLRGEPIQARPLGVTQRAWRWSRRRPALAALISVSMLSALLFAGFGWWSNARITQERDRAESSFRQALKAIDEMLTQVGEDDLALEPRMDGRRRVLLQRALALYQEFLADRGGDARLVWETAHAQRRIGDIERWLGRFSQSRDAYASALKLLQQSSAGRTPDVEHRKWQAHCQNYLGEACRRAGDVAGARKAFQDAVQTSGDLHAEFPKVPEYAQELARAQYNLGILARSNGELADADAAMNASLEELKRLRSNRPNDNSILHDLARVQLNLGALARSLKDPASAVTHSSEAIELFCDLGLRDSNRPEYRLELAVAHVNRGNAKSNLNQVEAAVADYESAADLLTHLIAEHPDVPTFQQELANTRNSLAAIYAAASDIPAAEREWTEATSLLQGLVQQNPEVPSYRADLGMTLGNLGGVLAKQERFALARQRLHEGIDHLEHALRANPRDPDGRRSLSSQLTDLGRVSLDMDDIPGALAAARKLATLDLASPDDRLVAACLQIRAAAKLDAALADGSEDSSAEAEQLCAEAAEWVVSTDQLDQVDENLRKFASELLATHVERHSSLVKAHAHLTSAENSNEEVNP